MLPQIKLTIARYPMGPIGVDHPELEKVVWYIAVWLFEMKNKWDWLLITAYSNFPAGKEGKE